MQNHLSFDLNTPGLFLEGGTNKFYADPNQDREINKFLFSREEHVRVTKTFFDHSPPSQEEPVAVILWGPPGSGKTSRGAQYVLSQLGPDLWGTFVHPNYDEGGAIDALQGYKQKISHVLAAWEEVIKAPYSYLPEVKAKRQSLYQQRLDHYREHRPDSQRVRSMILFEGMARKNNLFIDTTSASPGILVLVNNLLKAGYKHIEFVGVYAPLDLTIPRTDDRGVKVVEPNEVFTKYKDPIANLPTIIDAGYRFSLLKNETALGQAVPVFVAQDKEIVWLNHNGITPFTETMVRSADHMQALSRDPFLPEKERELLLKCAGELTTTMASDPMQNLLAKAAKTKRGGPNPGINLNHLHLALNAA